MATSAFFAVFRDISKLAATAADDLASQSSKALAAADDIASLTGSATVKTAGVAGDDLAVGAGQINGVSPNRELPALWRITKGSFLNKLLLAAGLLLVDFFIPWAVSVLLLLGALYLAFEGVEGLMDLIHGASHGDDASGLSEDHKVKGAIRTDLILSLEMLVIALGAASTQPFAYKVAILALVGIVMTVGVYGLIGFIIRLDDMGLALSKAGTPWKQRLGLAMVNAAPKILKVLGPIGMTAMFLVAGGILTHLVHWEGPHWALALLAEIGLGMVTGFLLLGLVHVKTKLFAEQSLNN